MSVKQLDIVQKWISVTKKKKLHIAFPDTVDERVYEAVKLILAEELFGHISLVGSQSIIEEQLHKSGLSSPLISIVDPSQDPRQEQLVESFYEKRKSKGMSLDEAKVFLQSNLYYAGMLLDQGEVDLVTAGCFYSTADVIKVALQTVGLEKGNKTLSSSFIMYHPSPREGMPNRMIYADAGVVIQPTEEQLVDIVLSAVSTSAQVFDDFDPIVGMLSFSTLRSASHPRALLMENATKLVKEQQDRITIPFQVFGETQFDAAVVPFVAKKKGFDPSLGGNANILIFPSLEAGNIAYKITQYLGGYYAFGPIFQGLAKTMNDLSRGASPEDIVVTSLIGALQHKS